MKTSIKTSMTAILLWSVAVVPAATVSYIATADMAYAKSDNAGGKGNGNSAGNSGKSGKSSSAGGKSKSTASAAKSTGTGSKSTTRARGNDPVGKVLDRMLGRDKKKVVRTTNVKRKATPAKTKTAVARSKAPKVRPNTDPMHASNLGNMNGALNANVNALLAHIKNGNVNGPVGHLAALAVANVNAEGAQEIVDLKEDFADLQNALAETPYDTVEQYYEALDGADPIIIDDIDTAASALSTANASQTTLDNALAGTPYATKDAYETAVLNGEFEAVAAVDDAISAYSDPGSAQADLNDALADNGYTALADYEADRAGVDGIEEITAVSDAIDVLGGDVEARADITESEPTDDAVADAKGDLAVQEGAEIAILDYWNKNTDVDKTISEEEQALLDKLNARLEADADVIAAAVGTDEPEVVEVGEDDAVAECVGETEGCAPGDDEIAVVAE